MTPTRRDRFGRWISNPRTGMAIALALLAGAVVAYVILSQLNAREALQTAKDAVETRNQTAAAATRRIDRLTARIAALETQAEENAALIGELRTEQAVLIEQLEREGVDPIVMPATTTTTRPTTSTTTSVPSTTTTTTQPPDEDDEPPNDDGICLLFICIGG